MSDQRKKVLLAVAASVALHVALLFLWALSVPWLAREPLTTPPEAAPEPIKVTIEEEKMPEVPAPVAVRTPPPVHFLDTSDMVDASPPPNPQLQSGKNTADTSALPPEGDERGPTQRGRKVPTFALTTVDPTPANLLAAVPPVATPAPRAETAPPLPRAVAQAAPRPPATPAPAATPLIERGDFALSEPVSLPRQPSAPDSNPYDPSFRAPAALTEPPRPTPLFANNRRGGYQPQQLKTAVSGNITNRGTGSIASVATPLGRYQAKVKEIVGQRWQGYIDQRTDVASLGRVTVHFLIGMDGHPRSTRVLVNTGNAALASISLQSILDSRLPPLTEDIVPDTEGGQLPMDLTFEFLDSNDS